MSGALALAVLFAWCALVGGAVLRLLSALPDRAETRWAVSIVTGFLVLHLLLVTFDSIGLPWTRGSLLIGGCALLAFLALLGRPRRRSRSSRSEPGVGRQRPSVDWSDGVAALAVLAFAASSWALRSPFSDFVYHWGLKGHRFFLVGGTDLEFLARPENVYLHPDYPNLLPETFAASSVLAGGFDARALMLSAPVFLGLLLLTIRALLRAAEPPPVVRRLVLAGLACALTAFCIGYFQGGSVDVPFALAVLLAVGALFAGPADGDPSERISATQLGVAAAFCAGLKFEGVPFAALAISLWIARAASSRRALDPRLGLRAPALRAPATWLALVAPSLVVVAIWAARVLTLDLLRESPTGGFELARVGIVATNLWRQSLLEEWLGLPLLLIVAPLLVVSSKVRWAALLISGQLAFYLWIYLSSPGDAAFYVLSTWPRLALHLLPPTVVGVTLALTSGGRSADSAATANVLPPTGARQLEASTK